MSHDAQTTSAPKGTLRKWGTRLSLALIALVLFGLVGLWTWGELQLQRLKTDVTVYRSDGDPLLPEDFDPPAPTPDDQNGALLLRDAAARLMTADDAWNSVDLLDARLPLRPDETRAIRTVLARGDESLRLARRATTMPAVDWGVRFRSPVLADMLPNLSAERNLSLLLQLAALEAHERRDDAAAVAYVRDGLFLAHAIDQRYGLVTHLVAVGIASRMASTAAELAPDLRVGNEPDAATPEQTRALVEALLDDRDWREGGRRAILGERLLEIDTVTSLLNGIITQPAAGTRPAPPPTVDPRLRDRSWVMRGMFLGDVRVMLRYSTALLSAIAQPDLPAARAAMPPFPQYVKDRPLLHIMASMLLPSLDRAVATHYTSPAHRRTAAVALALRAYAAQHGGRYPDSLDHLVPQYFPAVPADPYAPNSTSLRYLPPSAASPTPTVYSVGEDGRDNGASTRPTRANGPVSTEDLVVPLTRPPRPPPDDAAAEDPGPPPSTAPLTATSRPPPPPPLPRLRPPRQRNLRPMPPPHLPAPRPQHPRLHRSLSGVRQSIFVRRSRSAFPSTVTSDSAIAAAATSGLRSPNAASGIASTL